MLFDAENSFAKLEFQDTWNSYAWKSLQIPLWQKQRESPQRNGNSGRKDVWHSLIQARELNLEMRKMMLLQLVSNKAKSKILELEIIIIQLVLVRLK